MTVKRYDRGGYPSESGIMVPYIRYEELQRKLTAYEATVTNLTAQVQRLSTLNDALAVDNDELKRRSKYLLDEASVVYRLYNETQEPGGNLVDEQSLQELSDSISTAFATDAALAEIRNEARAEGADRVAEKARVIYRERHAAGDFTTAAEYLTASVFAANIAKDMRKEQGND